MLFTRRDGVFCVRVIRVHKTPRDQLLGLLRAVRRSLQ
jgi:hypothetical protein